MKKLVIIITAIVSLVACTDHNDLVLKYGELYNADVERATAFYHRVDSLIDCNYGREEKLDFEDEYEQKIENIAQFEANLDYAQFRFSYYTTKGLKRLVDESIKDWNYYVYVGKYHTYRIESRPAKKGYVILSTRNIID